MSNRALDTVRGRDLGSPTRKLVALLLADRANDDDWMCYPSQATLAAEAGLTDRTVRTALGSLEADGIIRRAKRYSSTTGKRMSDFIWLVRDVVLALPEIGSVQKPQSFDPGQLLPETDALLPETDDHHYRKSTTDRDEDTSYREPPLEPQLEPPGDTVSNVTHLTPKTPAPYDDPDFQFFWSIYPRKEDKFAAWGKWRSARKLVGADEIIAGCERYAAKIAAEGTSKQYIRKPPTWLNQRSWENDYEISKPDERSSKGQRPTLQAKRDAYLQAIAQIETGT